MVQTSRRHRYSNLLLEAARAIWLPWIVARVVVGVVLGLSRYRVNHGGAINTRGVIQSANGLMAFDAGWYRSIAEFGYGGASSESLRFFPLFPLSIRGFHFLIPLSWSTCTAIVANVAAFGAAMALYVLVTRDLKRHSLATHSVWLLCLGPASFVLVLGYAESMFLFFAILTLLALRRHAWWWAALLGLAASATRPVGILLIVPALVEVILQWKSDASKRPVASVASVLAPIAGFLGFCFWSSATYSNFWAPITIQRKSSHHGGLSDPFVVLGNAVWRALHGHHLGTAMHIPFIVLAVFLIVVAFRRLPRSYAFFSVAVVVVALSGSNLDSFERYLLSVFPLTIAAATFLESRRVAVVVLLLSGLVTGILGFLAFQGAYIP